jgi:DDE superfamily endonuclease
VETTKDRAAAAGHGADAEAWLAEFDTGFAAIAGRFSRVEPRPQARSFLLGLLSDVHARSCWQLAEQARDSSPQAIQRLWGAAVWDADAVRDDLRRYEVGALGDPDGLLIIDDTGGLKKGSHTVGFNASTTPASDRPRRCWPPLATATPPPQCWGALARSLAASAPAHLTPRCRPPWRGAPAAASPRTPEPRPRRPARRRPPSSRA